MQSIAAPVVFFLPMFFLYTVDYIKMQVKEAPMTSIADGAVTIQTSAESALSTPSWFGEVALLAGYLRKHGVLSQINERVRFARRRCGRYEVIDFLAVLFGYAISGERTLEAFYERLQPFAVPFMALFERDHLPARSTLPRFLAALTETPVEALRTLFLDDLESRPLSHEKQIGGLTDRAGNAWVVFDIDGTREAARQRALPQTEELPAACRRLDDVCAPGYTGRKRGQVVRTRTVISQAHSWKSARLVWQPGHRSLPNGTAPGPRDDHALPHGAPAPTGARPPPARWTIWHRGRAG
jgi:hypothetical protein